MGWSTLYLRHGLRLNNLEEVTKVREAVHALGQDADTNGLRLMDLSPTLKDSERGSYSNKATAGRYSLESLDEETYDRCCEAEGCALLYYVSSTLVLDESNGIKLDSNRCYGGGLLEFLNGDYDVEPLTEAQTKVLQAVAQALGKEYKLTFSLGATGSGCARSPIKFDPPAPAAAASTNDD
jgi:hypothetical protein